jgi:hypothetical protein
MTTNESVSTLTDAQLIDELRRLADAERSATVRLLRALAELDARRLYLGEGCSSLFSYCTQVLHLSEGGAYKRIEAARAARRFPIVFELLENGHVTLTVVRLLAPHLTDANHREVLTAARHKSKRDVEQIVVALAPKPPAPTSLRRLPAPGAAAVSKPVADPEVVCTVPHAPPPGGDVRSVDSWSSTTWSRSLQAAGPLSRISSFAAAHTTPTRRFCSSTGT